MGVDLSWLPSVNATLNALAAGLLVIIVLGVRRRVGLAPAPGTGRVADLDVRVGHGRV